MSECASMAGQVGWNSGRAVKIPSSGSRGADDMISCSSSSVEGSAQ